LDISDDWARLVRRYRLRHGLTQARLGAAFGVSQRTISRWERGEDQPSLQQQKRLRDLGWEPPGSVLTSLKAAVWHCPFARALSRTPRLNLQAVSEPALRKRPSVANWIGMDLAPIACGILEEMLDDRSLQASIAKREISCVLATSRSVLRTVEHPRIGTWRTVVTYLFHEGTLYSDAISMRVPSSTALGYKAVAMDEAHNGP
jgi:transcriptional regulator with XRE-family HTH domain